MITLDANILVYAHDRRTPEFAEQALDLVIRVGRQQDAFLPQQTVNEVAAVLLRKARIDPSELLALIADIEDSFTVAPMEMDDLRAGLGLVDRYQLSFWDAVLFATSARLGATWLLSQDMQDGFRALGLTVLNPFVARNQQHLVQLGLA